MKVECVWSAGKRPLDNDVVPIVVPVCNAKVARQGEAFGYTRFEGGESDLHEVD